MILTSSRTRPDGPVDSLPDYDLILAVSEVGPFAFDDAWIAAYDRPMVRWGDQGEMHALATYFRGVVYQNYVKIDYSIWPVELLSRIEASALLPDQLDVGYRVLLDKDQRDWMEAAILSGAFPRQTDGNAVPGARRGVLVGHDLRRQEPLA
jgi:aminoglycoside 6-adenylyltransferase